MMQPPVVSFCFTTYKRAAYLQKTLEGIRLQTYDQFEVIVSDNDPEQSGRPVVEGFNDPRFKYFPNKENLGMKKSFNESLRRSSGQYIVMIADDDPVYPDMLQTLMGLTEKYPGYGLYLGACNWFCTSPVIAKLYGLHQGLNSFMADAPADTVTTYSASEFLLNFFNFNIFPTYLWSTGFVKREVLVEMGGVPDYNTPFLGDYAYLGIASSHSGCVVINRALGHQTIHEENFGRGQNEQIITAIVNYVDYVSARIRHVENWPVIETRMKRFVALWALTHLDFLHRYFTTYKQTDIDLRQFEKQIFALPLMKPYYFKFWLKRHTPGLHNFLVKLKKIFKPGK